jgi:hypothetical protein
VERRWQCSVERRCCFQLLDSPGFAGCLLWEFWRLQGVDGTDVALSEKNPVTTQRVDALRQLSISSMFGARVDTVKAKAHGWLIAAAASSDQQRLKATKPQPVAQGTTAS